MHLVLLLLWVILNDLRITIKALESWILGTLIGFIIYFFTHVQGCCICSCLPISSSMINISWRAILYCYLLTINHFLWSYHIAPTRWRNYRSIIWWLQFVSMVIVILDCFIGYYIAVWIDDNCAKVVLATNLLNLKLRVHFWLGNHNAYLTIILLNRSLTTTFANFSIFTCFRLGPVSVTMSTVVLSPSVVVATMNVWFWSQ